ncbi:MAG: transposase [Deltaproteobacteria bacterium]|nr:transposase [Deltaproteobacteria bacterium]
MSNPFIHVDHKKFGDYARIFYPSFENNTKKITTVNLGRVIDLNEGIFKNRQRGVFHFDFKTGFTNLEEPKPDKEIQNSINEQAFVFGNIYAAHEILQRENLLPLFRSIYPNNEDTLETLILFRLLTSETYANAYYWWEGTYAKVLLPNASVQSQRLSKHLIALGRLNLESFFKKYLNIIYKDDTCGIVIDSTGIHNDINIDLSKINNHNGIISNEVRLIYVIDRVKKTPVYFRVVAGNIIDVTTLQNTINELKSYNIDIKYAVLDAGYYSEDNIKFLLSNGVNFVTRMVPNRLVAKEIIAEHSSKVVDLNNHVVHNGRLLYIKKVEYKLFGYKGYAYIAVDHRKMSNEVEALVNQNNSKSLKTRLSKEELEIESKLLGSFILLSSIDLDTTEIIPYYSSRNYIEQIFDFSKNNAMLGPIRVHTVDGLMGHVLINFLTVISYMTINTKFNNTKFSAKNALFDLGLLIAKLINNKLHIYEPNKTMKSYLKILNLPMPKIIDIKTNSCVDSNYFKI